MSSNNDICSCITLAGNRCTRKVKVGSKYCWQHKNCAKGKKSSKSPISIKKSSKASSKRKKRIETKKKEAKQIDIDYTTISSRIEMMESITTILHSIVIAGEKVCVENDKFIGGATIDKILGIGSFAKVSQSSIDGIPFAIKEAIIKRSLISLGKPRRGVPDWKEYIILEELLKPLILNKNSPNLPLLYTYYRCPSCLLPKKDEETREKKLVEGRCLIYISELAKGTLKDYFTVEHSDEEFFVAVFQILAGLAALQTRLQLVNLDIKSLNILYYLIKPGGYFCYIIFGKKFYVPNTGYLFVVNDYGVSHVLHPDIKLELSLSCALKGTRLVINGDNVSPIYTDWQCNPKSRMDQSLTMKKEKITDDILTLQGGMRIRWLKDQPQYPADSIFDVSGEVSSINPNQRDGGIWYDMQHYSIAEFGFDTQDAIKMFLGQGYLRESQPGKHKGGLVSDNFRNSLQKYVKPNEATLQHNSGAGNRGNITGKEIMQYDKIYYYSAAHLLIDWNMFTKVKRKQEIIETYNVTP